jgi:threonine aldolase
MDYLDFRSDTVTMPTDEMRRAMASAAAAVLKDIDA